MRSGTNRVALVWDSAIKTLDTFEHFSVIFNPTIPPKISGSLTSSSSRLPELRVRLSD
jgi:hypothetical protein